MYLSENLQKKWDAVLDHPDMPAIADPYRKAVTAVILENQAQEMIKEGAILNETGSPTNFAGTGGFTKQVHQLTLLVQVVSVAVLLLLVLLLVLTQF